ncbi:hypothetical protein [Myroides sp. LoEW2-1]|uniref:hypothetical protein n=1 Tax=Myroides sp. LoEW2-1 TaxID=2683192 RepID=UPI0013227E1F|nr:hypothetical protein [Myroides sp. LoEW2-1]MVX34505.1 hypothetical protein [Myroides sp. LoEW2-1]
MRYLYSFLALTMLFVTFGCSQSINSGDIKEINGYWEIVKAKLPNEEEKDYTINSSIDFFQIEENGVGFRQKVMPQFNGEYLTNDIQEDLTVEYTNEGTFLHYKTEFAEWKEEIVKINKEQLVVKNENDIMYYYKRPVPFSLK